MMVDNTRCLLPSFRNKIFYQVYNRVHDMEKFPRRIDGVKIWVGIGLTGGNYNGAQNIGTIKYESGTNPYIFSDLAVRGSSVQIQGGVHVVQLAEVEVYEGIGENILELLSTPTIGDIKGLRVLILLSCVKLLVRKG